MIWTEMISSIYGIEILMVTDVKMSVDWNEHPVIYIQGAISDANTDEFERLLYEEGIVDVKYREQNGQTQPIFYGYVKSLRIGIEDHNSMFEIVLVGISNEMDRETKTRVFQEKSMTYNELINTIVKPYGITIVSEQELDNCIGQIFVQYMETDWDFLKRVVSQFNAKILSGYLDSSRIMYVGICDTNPMAFETSDVQVISDLNTLCKKQENGLGYLLLEDGIFYECQTNVLYNVGSSVMYKDKKLYILSAKVEFKKGEMCCKYQLGQKNAISENKYYNAKIAGVSLDGIIVDVNSDKVKVKFKEEDNSKEDMTTWLPYSTVFSSPDGTGWYCMPEVGDNVRIYFPNEIENNCYVISSVHMNGKEMAGMRKNPDIKCISTKYGKKIELSPTDIKITNSKGMMICISDTDGIVMISGEDINLSANGNISLISATDTIDMCAAESIIMKQGDNTITIADEIIFDGKKIKVQ